MDYHQLWLERIRFLLLLKCLKIPCKSIAMQAAFHMQDLFQEAYTQGD